MLITIQFSTANDAFTWPSGAANAGEIRNVLHKAGTAILQQATDSAGALVAGRAATLVDSNGNTVGTVRVDNE